MTPLKLDQRYKKHGARTKKLTAFSYSSILNGLMNESQKINDITFGYGELDDVENLKDLGDQFSNTIECKNLKLNSFLRVL